VTLQLADGVHASIRERIAVTLRQAILSGDLVPGDRVVEAELAAKLGTSRAPVREAMRELVNEGFLESHPYRATRVSGLTATEVSEVLVPIRVVIETFALRHLIRHGDPEIRGRLWSIVDAMRACADRADRLGVIEHDLTFHRTLMHAAPYTHPLRVWASITPVIYRAFAVGTTHAVLHETTEGHVAVLSAIEGGDEDHAVAVLRGHVEEMELRFVSEDASARSSALEDHHG
jgi:DNA-binding GntR family transcriptional regulator